MPPGGSGDQSFTAYELRYALMAPSLAASCPVLPLGTFWNRLHPYPLRDLLCYSSLPGQQKPKQLSFLHLPEQLQLNTFPIKDPRRALKHRQRGLLCSSLIRSLWTALPHDPDRIPQSYPGAAWAQLLLWDPDPCFLEGQTAEPARARLPAE